MFLLGWRVNMISDCCKAPLAYGTEPFDGFGMCGECYEMSEVIDFIEENNLKKVKKRLDKCSNNKYTVSIE